MKLIISKHTSPATTMTISTTPEYVEACKLIDSCIAHDISVAVATHSKAIESWLVTQYEGRCTVETESPGEEIESPTEESPKKWKVTVRRVTYADAEVEVNAVDAGSARESAMELAETLNYDDESTEYEDSTIYPEEV